MSVETRNSAYPPERHPRRRCGTALEFLALARHQSVLGVSELKPMLES